MRTLTWIHWVRKYAISLCYSWWLYTTWHFIVTINFKLHSIWFNAGQSPKTTCIRGSHFLDHTIHLEDTPRGHNYLLHMLAKKRKLLFLDSRPLNQGTWCWTTVPSTIMLPSSFERCLFMSGPSGGHILRWCFVWAFAQRAWGLACFLWRGHWMTAFILSGRKTDSWFESNSGATIGSAVNVFCIVWIPLISNLQRTLQQKAVL